MGKGAKRLAQMRNNPANDWQIADIEVVCRAFGIELKKPTGGSHYGIYHPLAGIQTIPAHRPIKVRYIKEFVKFVDRLPGETDDS
jgi:hypothetical protein